MALIQIEISDLDEKLLNHEMDDIKNWLQATIAGRAYAIKEGLLREAIQCFFNDKSIQSIPTTVEECLTLYFSKPYYKNAKERQKEMAEQLEMSMNDQNSSSGLSSG